MNDLKKWALFLGYGLVLAAILYGTHALTQSAAAGSANLVEEFPEYACALSEEERQAVVFLSSKKGAGTAFAIADGWYLTARHVLQANIDIGPSSWTLLTTRGAQILDQRLVQEYFLHETQDIALVRASTVGLRPFQLADGPPYVHQKVLLSGYPLGLANIVTEGHVQYESPGVSEEVSPALVVTAPAASGNSGGPLLTCQGKVAGMLIGGMTTEVEQSWIRPIRVSVNHLSITIPVSTLRAFLVERGVYAAEKDVRQAGQVHPRRKKGRPPER